jgi:hypothetical protein
MVFQRFISRYEAILDTLNTLYNERKGPETLGLKLIVSRKDIVAIILLMCDILEPVNMLSLYIVSAGRTYQLYHVSNQSNTNHV